MKRLITLMICAIALLCSCKHTDHTFSSEWIFDEASHYRVCEVKECKVTAAVAEHSFGEDIDETDGSTFAVCAVCGYIKRSESLSNHEHSLQVGYTSSSTHHWIACSGCNVKSNENAHEWSDINVIIPPTSDSEGMAEKHCTVCGKFSSEVLEHLPEKMSHEEWETYFKFENLRITEKSKTGSITSISKILEVDGNLVASINESGTMYDGRKAIWHLDWSRYYEFFSHYGENVYKSSGFELAIDGTNQRIEDAVASFADGRLKSIAYTVTLGGFGSVSYSYTFSDHGAISLNPIYLNAQTVSSLLDKSSFECNLTLSYQKQESILKSTECELTVLDGTYVCKYMKNGRITGVKNGSANYVASGISENLSSFLRYFRTDEFVYEDLYEDYTYVGCGTVIPDIGIMIECDIFIANGRLSSLNVVMSDGTVYSYYIEYV